MTKACLICGTENWRTWLTPRKFNIPAGELYGAAAGVSGTQSLLKCNNCGFIIEWPRLSDREIISGYESAVNAEHDSQFTQRVKSFEKTIKRNLKYLPQSPATVLDIGCAGGAFLLAAQNLGYTVTGIEPSGELVNSAKSKSLDIVQGTAENARELINGTFDIVSLWDVIEHVLDPQQTLEGAISCLSEDGLLVINIPDIGTWTAKVFGRKNWWISSVHIYHFSSKHLENLLGQYKFRVVSKKRFIQSLELGYLFQIAEQMGIPFTGLINRILPDFLRRIPIRYYASQTTLIAKRAN